MGAPTWARGPGEVPVLGRDLCPRKAQGARGPCGCGLGWGTPAPALQLQAGQGLEDARLAQGGWRPTEGRGGQWHSSTDMHSLAFRALSPPNPTDRSGTKARRRGASQGRAQGRERATAGVPLTSGSEGGWQA